MANFQKTSNVYISATGHPVHFRYSSRWGFQDQQI